MDRDELRQRLADWYAGEREKLRPLTRGQRAAYVWDYYWLWIVGILAAVFLLAFGIRQMFWGTPEPWFYAAFANTYADLGSGSSFQEDFTRYATEHGFDAEGQGVTFNARLYCDPTREDLGNQYYRLLLTLLDGELLDAVVMEGDRLAALGASGRLMDLEDPRTVELFRLYRERIIWCTPQDETYGKEQVPVGIDLTGTAFAEYAYAGTEPAVGISALSPHVEQAGVFLAYLFEEGEAW